MDGESAVAWAHKPVLRARFEATRTRTERWLCYARAAFCSMVLARFLYIRGFQEEGLRGTGVWVNCACIALVVAFSLCEARTLRQRTASFALLGLSVLVDAGGCFVSLAQDVLWPSELRAASYTGVLAHPDVCAQLIMVMASPLRLSAPLALLSGVLNLSFAGLLLGLDYARWGGFQGYVQEEIGLYAVCLLAVTALAVLAAEGARRLVLGLHEARLRVQCAHTNLASLASDHHDVKSLLSAALLHADMLKERWSQTASDTQEAARLRHIASDLAAVSAELSRLCERTFTEMALLRAPERVRTAQVLTQTAHALRCRFPELVVRLQLRAPVDTCFLGGAAALERVLYNLVANAQAGDGTRGARAVLIEAETRAGALQLAVHDDGPGFAATSRVSALSTKAQGSGVGLQLVEQLVRASDGRLTLARSPVLGGALVRLELPGAAPARATGAVPAWAPLQLFARRARSG
jgi:signal transduction histidine kinase